MTCISAQTFVHYKFFFFLFFFHTFFILMHLNIHFSFVILYLFLFFFVADKNVPSNLSILYHPLPNRFLALRFFISALMFLNQLFSSFFHDLPPCPLSHLLLHLMSNSRICLMMIFISCVSLLLLFTSFCL